MINRRKWAFMIVFTALFISFVLNSDRTFASNNNKISDMPKSHKAYKSVLYVVDKKIMDFYSGKKFKPNNTVSKSDAALFVGRATNVNPKASVKNPKFSDLSTKSTNYGYIATLTNAGAFVKTKAFNASSTITKQELARLLVEAYDLPIKKGKNFTDGTSSSYKNYVSTVASYGLLSPKSPKTFGAKDKIKRADIALAIHKTVLYKEELKNQAENGPTNEESTNNNSGNNSSENNGDSTNGEGNITPPTDSTALKLEKTPIGELYSTTLTPSDMDNLKTLSDKVFWINPNIYDSPYAYENGLPITSIQEALKKDPENRAYVHNGLFYYAGTNPTGKLNIQTSQEPFLDEAIANALKEKVDTYNGVGFFTHDSDLDQLARAKALENLYYVEIKQLSKTEIRDAAKMHFSGLFPSAIDQGKIYTNFNGIGEVLTTTTGFPVHLNQNDANELGNYVIESFDNSEGHRITLFGGNGNDIPYYKGEIHYGIGVARTLEGRYMILIEVAAP